MTTAFIDDNPELGDEGVEAICAALRGSTTIATLRLAATGITSGRPILHRLKLGTLTARVSSDCMGSLCTARW